MARNGSGIQSSPGSSYPAVSSTTIESAKFNAVIDDINSEISRSIASDGQTTITADIPLNSNTITGIRDASASGEPVEYDQYLAGLASVSGDGFEAGTEMIFIQAAAPTGWTINSGITDRQLYINTASGGSTGGSDNPLLMDKVPSHTHTATTSSSQVSHAHTFLTYSGTTGVVSRVTGALNNGAAFSSVQTEFATPAITSTTTVNANSSADVWEPKYVTGIICSKDA